MNKPSGRSHYLSATLNLLPLVSLMVSLSLFSQVIIGAPALKPSSTAPPRYLFLFIGDGMGAAQIKLADAVLENGHALQMTSFPVLGMATTHAENRYITDSGAASTALATGRKTTVGTISMAGNHLDTLVTIAEMAKAKGMKTGIVSSVGINDATPACFYAHTPSRSNSYDIAVQMASSGFDYFGGGYAEGNLPENRQKAPAFKGDIAILMRSAKYLITHNRNELQKVKPGTRCWAYTGYDAKAAMDYAMDRNPENIGLEEFTREGIRLLDNPHGFFMMVEGGKIDWACHANDAAAAAHDVKAFDNAIAEALAFYRRHPKETLIIVTADHECGGLSLGNRTNGYDTRLSLLRRQKISHQRFSEKVSSWKKSGTVTFPMAIDSVNTYYGISMKDADSTLALTPANYRTLEEAYTTTIKPESTDSFTSAVTGLLNVRAGIGWSSNAHTAVPVQVFAIGKGAERFRGFYDNTDIAKKIIQIAELKNDAPSRINQVNKHRLILPQ
ncbi:alkaline phosphatase [Chlorobium sp. KB01]|uniref:alkaline phosphatase n=1 Tax=Chlorobium sp. KB01 TaxID=1917528 RepID=UPI000978AF7C|nr:alkaline phosphatase [Chlorobium sp. KB01]